MLELDKLFEVCENNLDFLAARLLIRANSSTTKASYKILLIYLEEKFKKMGKLFSVG